MTLRQRFKFSFRRFCGCRCSARLPLPAIPGIGKQRCGQAEFRAFPTQAMAEKLRTCIPKRRIVPGFPVLVRARLELEPGAGTFFRT